MNLTPKLRGLHRDVGYLLVGLTFVYALSGLAVNHIADWDPSFVQTETTYLLPPTIERNPIDPADDAKARALAEHIARELELGPVKEVYASSPTELDLTLETGQLTVDLDRGAADYSGQRPRPFLRLANWLHTNRGKKAWTVIADAYAILLLGLATSGLFLVRERGLFGRKTVLVAVGVLTPILYVALSGGPAAHP